MKAQKDRYAGAVTQVAVRVLHEIFEADRGGKIHSIALTVATCVISPATGLSENVPLVIVAADRETFGSFDLAKVVPRRHLSISAHPYPGPRSIWCLRTPLAACGSVSDHEIQSAPQLAKATPRMGATPRMEAEPVWPPPTRWMASVARC